LKDFIGRGGVLRRLDAGGRLVYTAFLLLTLAGLLTAALLHGDGMGTDAATAAAYWRGDEAQALYPKSYRQLLELTHFHLFTEPVTWLVVAHLYALGGGSRGVRAGVIVGTLLAMAVQIALPWAVVYAGAGFATLLIPANMLMGVGLLGMAAVSIRDMWWAPSTSP
jgi:hypothetical protein